jgi:hypothetical protein
MSTFLWICWSELVEHRRWPAKPSGTFVACTLLFLLVNAIECHHNHITWYEYFAVWIPGSGGTLPVGSVTWCTFSTTLALSTLTLFTCYNTWLLGGLMVQACGVDNGCSLCSTLVPCSATYPLCFRFPIYMWMTFLRMNYPSRLRISNMTCMSLHSPRVQVDHRATASLREYLFKPFSINIFFFWLIVT